MKVVTKVVMEVVTEVVTDNHAVVWLANPLLGAICLTEPPMDIPPSNLYSAMTDYSMQPST